MAQVIIIKDPKIKLFGKTIELPEVSAAAPQIVEAPHCCDAAGEDRSTQDPLSSSTSAVQDTNFNGDAEDQQSHKSQCGPEQDHAEEKDESHLLMSDELKDSNETPPVVENSKALSADSEAGANQTKTEEDQSETANLDEKTLKKPDKILPCPRCNSMDTKFCYFNNYNVNQPRHFCKNCQRYWTAGGTMRNVPVGAGRRKNKSAASQFRHLSIPEALPNGVHHHPVINPDGTLLAFSSDVPLCESMVSVLNIADKTIRNVSKNGFHKPMELGLSVSHGSKDNGDDRSSGSSNNTLSSNGEAGETRLSEQLPNCHPYPPQVPCYPGAPWPYQWPNFAPASFPMPFYPTPPPYWGCTIPGGWNIPWVIPPIPTTSQSQGHPSTGPNSPTLGKHSREDNIIKPTNTEEETRKESDPEKCLWVPKTLRIDDPGEAAKSSIWATLGIKNDRADSVSCGGGGGSLFKAFQSQSKGGEKNHVKEASTVLQANPAAFSRSVNFHESS